ncbi:hypothetical protein [Streptomyces sp. NPDC007063]|uniref:hypothetical protein n=1 Tax=Streptomyces sp. NPDC007063 TaxID=3364772 RepID=UPI003676CEF9
MLEPDFFLEALYLAAERLGCAGVGRRKNALCCFVIVEQSRFMGHHVVFCGPKDAPFCGEFAFPPLAETPSSNTAVRFTLVAPEEQKAHRVV